MKRFTLQLSIIFFSFLAIGQSHIMDTQEFERLSQTERAERDAAHSKSGTSPLMAKKAIHNSPYQPLTRGVLPWRDYPAHKNAPIWLHWDNGEFVNAIGTGSAFVFSVASRFDTSDLVDYAGTNITKIRFVPNVAAATYTLKVWQGNNPPTEIYSQEVTSVAEGVWNEIDLDEAVAVDHFQELWFGYEVNTPSGFPAGADNGPPVAGKGNMILWEGDWQPLTNINSTFTFNWNLQAYVEILTDPGAPAAPSNLLAVADEEGALEVSLTWVNPSLTHDGQTLSDLDFIYVYRGQDLIHTIANPVVGAAESFMDDQVLENGFVNYTVFASNDLGDGQGAYATLFVGTDVPAIPENIILTADGSYGYLTWTAPAMGLNGGYINPDDLTYTLVRMPGNVELAENITTTEFLDTTIPGIGNYYYFITANNSEGTGGTAVSNVVLLDAEGFFMYETFDYELNILPLNWELTGVPHNWTVNNTQFAGGTAPELQMSWGPAFDGLSRVVSYPLDIQGYSSLRLKFNVNINNYISVNEGEMAGFDVSYDGGETWVALWETEIINHIPATEKEIFFDVPPGKSELHFGIRFDGNSFNINYIYIDNIVLEPVLEHDLVAVSISGNSNPSVGNEYFYTITVLNAGSNAQSDYTVKLMKEGGEELVTVDGSLIEFAETLTFQLPWTPESGEEGPTYLYGYVDFDDDELPDNNQTDNLNIVVQPGDILAVTIGDGEFLTFQPYTMVLHYSLLQTLYYPEEIGLGDGVITGIQYVNSFDEDWLQRHIQIWLGETEMENLADGWVDPSTLQLVFDGLVDFPEGVNNIFIPFDDFYVYGGSNLVIYNYKMDDEWAFYKNFFNTMVTGSNRTRGAQQNDNPFHPANPPAGSARDYFPNITMFFSNAGLGALEGTVTDGTDPLEGVLVSLLGTSSTRVTDEEGFYEFSAILPDTYNVEFSKLGYETIVMEGVIIEADEVTVLDVVVLPSDQFTVSGTVIGNDAVLQEGAVLTLEGYVDYMATTNAEGEFSFDDVFGGTYLMTVNAAGYEVFIDADFAVDADITDLEITIIEIIVPPFGLLVDTVGYGSGEAMFSWNNLLGTTLFEDFEEGSIPADWDQVITNTGSSGPIQATWNINNYSTADYSPFGTYHAGLWWDIGNQNEWLISPEVSIGSNYELEFWSVVFLGSVNNDHYYVKISTDGGSTWTELWDASVETGGWNQYATPFVLDLSDYNGQDVHIAFHAVDGPTNDGLWYIWFIDNVAVGPQGKKNTIAMSEFERNSKSATRVIEDAESQMIARDGSAFTVPAVSNRSKALEGFNVFLNDVEIASGIIETHHMFTGLPGGTHTAGVQSVYTTGVSEIMTIDFEVEGPEFARAQIIHNSADAAVANMDLYVNGELVLPNVGFRQATPFIDIVAGVTLQLHIAPTGADSEDAIGPIEVMFTPGETYVVIANGIVSDTGYDPVQPFGLFVFDQGQEAAGSEVNTDLLVFHGVTDAPEVSVWAMGFDNALFAFEYGEFAPNGYLPLPTNDYVIEIRDASGPTTIVAYEAPLATLGLDGQALVVVASGFLNPANNSDGPAFGLWVATTAGGDLIELDVFVSVQDITMGQGNISMFPNPSTDMVNLRSASTMKEVRVVDTSGRVVYNQVIDADQHQINVRQFESGIYFVQVLTAEGMFTGKLQIHK